MNLNCRFPKSAFGKKGELPTEPLEAAINWASTNEQPSILYCRLQLNARAAPVFPDDPAPVVSGTFFLLVPAVDEPALFDIECLLIASYIRLPQRVYFLKNISVTKV
jgi:hypothetical protein